MIREVRKHQVSGGGLGATPLTVESVSTNARLFCILCRDKIKVFPGRRTRGETR